MTERARELLEREQDNLRRRKLRAMEEAVVRSYRFSVATEEFNSKCTKEAVRKVALYMLGTDYLLALFDSATDEEPNRTVQLLFDFLAYTEVDQCIHPNVFARGPIPGTEYCGSCGLDIPRQQL